MKNKLIQAIPVIVVVFAFLNQPMTWCYPNFLRTMAFWERDENTDKQAVADFERMWIDRAVQLTREIAVADETTRNVARHACQGCSILLNDILGEMGISSKIVGLDFKWFDPRWQGLHYAVKTKDGVYADAQPEAISPNWNDFGGPLRPPYRMDLTKKGFVLYPDTPKYEQYKKAEEWANRRDWGFAAPEFLREQYKESAKLKDLYAERIRELVHEYQIAGAQIAGKKKQPQRNQFVERSI